MQIPNLNPWIERFGASRVPPIAWVLLLWFLVSVPAITLRGAHYEEGTTIGLARGMFEDGHWLAPYRYGERFVERPVLVSWLLGAAGAATGHVDPIMARVPIVLSILGSALLLFWFVNRYATIYGALFAAACFLVSPMMLQKLVTAEVDSVVSFLTFAAFVTWWIGRERGGPSLAGWAAIGAILSAAALVKGPQQPAFFFVGVGAYLAFRRDWGAFSRLALCGLMPLAVVAAWYAAVYQPGDFAVWAGHSRISAGIGYAAYVRGAAHFLAQFALEALPGIVLAVPLAIDLYRRRFNTQRELTLVLLLYAFLVTALLVLWPGARTRYAMPAILAIAALAGLGFDHFRLVRPWLANVAAGIAAVLIGYALILNWLVMPLAPQLFEPFAQDGRYVGQAVAGRPAPLLVTPEALNANVLVYVPGPIRVVPLAAMRAHARPFWALVTPEQRVELDGKGVTVIDHNTLHWPTPRRFLRVEAD